MPQLPPGVPNIVNVVNSGHVYTAARMQSMANLVLGFQVPLDTAHIVDKTGLTGKYDFTLEYSASGLPSIVETQSPNGAAGPIDNLTDPAPDLFTALQKQLGLKLTKSKMPLKVIVIDHIEKIPADN
jgi:uncharacterized protein (TIGR03435 family)